VIKIHAILLAAGYATRLYPLTENTPKPLLEITGKPIVEHILFKLNKIEALEKIYIVTNDKFYSHFNEWLSNYEVEKPIEIINDMTRSNEDRLGAIGDINFVHKKKDLHQDVMVIAGDNLFEMSLVDCYNFFKKKQKNVIVLYDVGDIELAKHYGVVEVIDSKVAHFAEKPKVPKSTLASTGIYIFTKRTLNLIEKYISQGLSTDKSGEFVEWLHKREDIFAYVTEKKWYDIGSMDQLQKANKYYKIK
jgi:glucose-1-phosphate thymidylyltransferase